MKTINLISTLLLIFISSPIFAQMPREENHGKSREMIEAEKIAFITRELNLTSDEAKVFWPIYNEFENERKVNHQQRRKLIEEIKSKKNTLTDKEADDLAKALFDIRNQDDKMIEKYHTKFKSVLSSKKILLLMLAEMEFKTQLLKGLKDENHIGPKLGHP